MTRSGPADTRDGPDGPLASRLRQELAGDVLFSAFDRGRYATDASIYQIRPLGVVVPRTVEDAVVALQIAREEGVPVIVRGAGTSQSGQCIGRGLIVDTSKHLTGVSEVDAEAGTVAVEPGVVLDHLNALLRPRRLFFPVDPATSSRATLGGMAGNNSAGARSIRYGMMVDNVAAIEGVLADGTRAVFGPVGPGPGLAPRAGGGAGPLQAGGLGPAATDRLAGLTERLRALHAREHREIRRRWPRTSRNVAGYNLNRLSRDGFNLSDLLVGSEGTLALFTRLHLELAPIPGHRVLGVCHFDDLYAAVEATREVVELDPAPSAVELVDRALLDLAARNPAFRPAVQRFASGNPEALLVVELAGDDHGALEAGLGRLGELVGGLRGGGRVVEAVDPAFQDAVWGVRKAGLNIAMSMVGDRKPLAFIEDCAVPLKRLEEYVRAMDAVFRREEVDAIWYAHASVGTLHVRPALNLKNPADVVRMRRIAEAAHELVLEFGGTHSGEHGDGILRSEFHEKMLGERIAAAFREVKEAFDPGGGLNPDRIVDAPNFDDRDLLRYGPGYRTDAVLPVLDWSAWGEAGAGGFGAAVEMCNNNGACRKTVAGVMCPSFRATRDEEHGVRGRANVLRLALSGQLGPDAFTSDGMHQALELCVGCKGCRSECPTGVDMARMKVEFLHHYHRRHGVPLRERLVAHLPRYAPWAARFSRLANLTGRIAPLRRVGEGTLGISARRPLPAWRRDHFGRLPGEGGASAAGEDSRDRVAVLFVDTFSRWFEPENARAAKRLLERAGYRVALPRGPAARRPLCCGRTFLNAGLVDEARAAASRLADALGPFVREGAPVVGLEPSCLFTLKDELPSLLPEREVGRIPRAAVLLEELLEGDAEAGRLSLADAQAPGGRLWVHGHCHQKSFDAFEPTLRLLRRLPGADVRAIDSGCCGLAGAFGYEAEHYEMSMAMGELDLLPALRQAGAEDRIVADGTSCRHQIRHGAGREAVHVARLLDEALGSA